MKTIVTIVDDSIAINYRRKKAALKEIYGKARSIDLSKLSHGLSPILTEEQSVDFNSLVMSDKYIDLDKSAPHSSRVLRKFFKKGYAIIYLTTRKNAMRDGTLMWLKKNKFPYPDGDKVLLLMHDRDYATEADFLNARMKEINYTWDVVFGVASSLDVIFAYSNVGIRPIIIDTGTASQQLNVSLENTTRVGGWKEIERFLEEQVSRKSVKEEGNTQSIQQESTKQESTNVDGVDNVKP